MINILLLTIVSLTFVSLVLIVFFKLKKYSKNQNVLAVISKFEKFSSFLIIIILSYLVVDMGLFRLLGHGYPSNRDQEKIQRLPTPYDFFSGKPNARDHNSDGYRGKDFKKAGQEQLSIAFFGGSTGYNGNPPIISLVGQNLNSQNINTVIYNFSSVSSNHNQHLNRLLKFSNYKFDLVIFYGGFNETFQTLFSDPRPGYPFNFWTVGELHPLKFVLLKYFPFIAEIDKQTGKISGINKIRNEVKLGSDEWLNKLLNNYIDTHLKTKKLTEEFIEPNLCNKSTFMGIYQPISLPKITNELLEKLKPNLKEKIVNKTKEKIKRHDFIVDLSDLYEENMFTDSAHVNEEAKNIMALEITKVIKEKLSKACVTK